MVVLLMVVAAGCGLGGEFGWRGSGGGYVGLCGGYGSCCGVG